MAFHITSYNQSWLDKLRAGGPDDNGQPAEHAVSDGAGNPCRSCLDDIPEGAEMLIAAARPFSTLQPYAETGPVFFCAGNCTPWNGAGLPPVLTSRQDYLVKGYTADERINYGTGAIVNAADLDETLGALLSRTDVAFADIRSSRNNCFQARAFTANPATS